MLRIASLLLLCSFIIGASKIEQTAKDAITYSKVYVDTTAKSHPNLDASKVMKARSEVADALNVYCGGGAGKCQKPKDRLVRSRLTDNLKAALANLDQALSNLEALTQ